MTSACKHTNVSLPQSNFKFRKGSVNEVHENHAQLHSNKVIYDSVTRQKETLLRPPFQ